MHAFDLVAVIDGVHSVPPVADLRMLAFDGLTAVLAASPRPLFVLPQSQKQVLIEAANRLRWQEACMPLGTLLPVRKDSPLTEEGALKFLKANRPLLGKLMDRFARHVQVQVTVSWRLDAVLDRFRDSDELAPLFAQGRTTPDKLAEALARLTARLSQTIDRLLSSASAEIAPLPVTETVLWNGAVLVQEQGFDALVAAVEAVDAIWPEGLQIRQIGPAPVASFATLSLQKITAQQIEAAHKALGLPFAPSASDVSARRREELLAASGDMIQREEIRLQCEIIEAAARFPTGQGEFAMARLWSEGQSADPFCCKKVA